VDVEMFLSLLKKGEEKEKGGNTKGALSHYTEAIIGHDTYELLPRIKLPTLVISGDNDRLLERILICGHESTNFCFVEFPLRGIEGGDWQLGVGNRSILVRAEPGNEVTIVA
jgi:hypothetical protein